MKEHPKFPASVSAIIFNEQGQILLVSPDGQAHWQVIAGWLEQETIYDALIREIQEELGAIEIQVIDILDTHIFYYAGSIPLISVFGLVKYLQGTITTRDDIQGYTWRWFEPEELHTLQIDSPYQFEIIEKALFLIDLYQKNPGLSFLKYNWQSLT